MEVDEPWKPLSKLSWCFPTVEPPKTLIPGCLLQGGVVLKTDFKKNVGKYYDIICAYIKIYMVYYSISSSDEYIYIYGYCSMSLYVIIWVPSTISTGVECCS